MSDLKKVGAVWLKKKEGKPAFMSGEIEPPLKEKSRIFIFKNEKEKDNHPDYTLHTDAENIIGHEDVGSAPGYESDAEDVEVPF